jgi:RNA polymerase sigma-70 factor (ECF subfamily)
MGGVGADRPQRQGRGPAGHPGATLNEIFREHWWAAVALVARLTGDLDAAEDAVQEACALALVKWPDEGVPGNPRAWLVSTAKHKALDRLRREARRPAKERAAAADPGYAAPGAADELSLIFMCCHPALDAEAQIALTLRCVCGLATPEIAAAFLVPEATLAQRVVRAKRKIKQAGIRLTPPAPEDLPARLAAVMRVIYLVFTQGHMPRSGPDLVRADLCEEAVRLARGLAALLPGEPEVTGLLALLLLTDARRDARSDRSGEIVLLADQDRGKWDEAKIAEGAQMLEAAMRAGRPGPYQLHAAIAACHSAEPDGTDWRQIAGLYAALVRVEPTAVNEANRAVAVAMADGPAAGIAILDGLGERLAGWAQFHVARAELLRRAGRTPEAASAYAAALNLGMSAPLRAFIERRAAELQGQALATANESRPDWSAVATASVRLGQLSLASTLATWRLDPCSEIPSFLAICLLLMPWESSTSVSCSRGVSCTGCCSAEARRRSTRSCRSRLRASRPGMTISPRARLSRPSWRESSVISSSSRKPSTVSSASAAEASSSSSEPSSTTIRTSFSPAIVASFWSTSRPADAHTMTRSNLSPWIRLAASSSSRHATTSPAARICRSIAQMPWRASSVCPATRMRELSAVTVNHLYFPERPVVLLPAPPAGPQALRP